MNVYAMHHIEIDNLLIYLSSTLHLQSILPFLPHLHQLPFIIDNFYYYHNRRV